MRTHIADMQKTQGFLLGLRNLYKLAHAFTLQMRKIKWDKLGFILTGVLVAILFLIWTINASGPAFAFDWIGWTDSAALCSECTDNCTAKVTFSVEFPRYNPDAEMQCKLVLDNQDMYEQGKYYCDFEQSLGSSFSADPWQDHYVEVCCGTHGLNREVDCIGVEIKRLCN